MSLRNLLSSSGLSLLVVCKSRDLRWEVDGETSPEHLVSVRKKKGVEEGENSVDKVGLLTYREP